MHAISCSSNAVQSSCRRPAPVEAAAQSTWSHTASKQRCRGALLAARALPHVKVIGVGGSASRMVGQLWDNEALGKLDLEWLIINTDVQELSCTFMPDQDKLLIGASATKWAGAQGNHLMGQAAAEESTEDISKALEGADLVLLLAGMGGGTGRGAAPVVADVARQQGTCTISIAMVPEQPTSQPMLLALAGLQAAADAAVAVRCTGGSTNGSGADAHQLPVTCLVQGIADLLLGYDPADLDEVQAAVADGLSTLGFAVAQGYDSLTRAVFAAMSNRECLPILQQASGVLCFVAGSEDIPDSWVTDVQEVLSSQCSSAHTVLVRAVQSDLPPGTTAATVLITTPAHSMLKEVASEEESAANQSADASAPKPLAENGTVRHLADVADAVNGDAPNAAGDEEQQQQQHD